MPKSLVIVESPTKARTIERFLDDNYIVESSIGHIRDLPDSAGEIPAEVKGEPWSRLGIDVENDFKPLYVVPKDKKAHVNKLKKLLKDVDRLYLATDEDREGEAISWHLMEVLKPKVPTQRLVFHEITKEAIQTALQSPREVDDRLVTAQETRRLLDRLYGYEISPLLWRKIAPALSAGRVQSVSVRIIVERERARMAFNSAAYWDLEGLFAGKDGKEFKADLISLDDKRLVSGKDFDDATGQVNAGKKDLVHLDEAQSRELAEKLKSAQFTVTRVEKKPYASQPPAPFTTSTLQQEGNRKLGMSSRETMRTAQGLYEQGHITYMRTDSTTLSEQAIKAARSQIAALYGKEYMPVQPRVYKSKVKNAQEAHEAIRPAGETFRKPEELRSQLNEREQRLYEMIWKRTMASQMENARGQRLILAVQAEGAVFQATGKTIEFPGFLRAYVEGSDDPQAELGDQEKVLPALSEGETVACRGMEARDHKTQPPARFTEASLIKELEKEGIGRPSTYASIIDTIIRREYVTKKGSALVPSFVAFAVVRLMEQYFTHLVDIGFTSRMEDVLDAISRGEQESLPYLHEFYDGDKSHPGLRELLKAEIDPRWACTIPMEVDKQEPINIRIGRYGPYLERGEDRASLPMGLAPDELTLERAGEILERGSNPDVLGSHPETGMTIYLKNGRYGPYVQMGEQGESPKMKSLLPGQTPETLNLENALQLLTLPRVVGDDPESGDPIVADFGRYGPYIKRGTDTRSLSSPDVLFSLTVPEALEILKQPKAVRRGAATVLKELGAHPETAVAINLMKGRYGPYVTDGEINASVPRGVDPEHLDLKQAVDLIKERIAKGPVKKRGRVPAKKAAPKKTAAKKAAPKKAAAKKTASATTTAKKTVKKAAKKPAAKKAAPKKAVAKKTGAKKPASKQAAT